MQTVLAFSMTGSKFRQWAICPLPCNSPSILRRQGEVRSPADRQPPLASARPVPAYLGSKRGAFGPKTLPRFRRFQTFLPARNPRSPRKSGLAGLRAAGFSKTSRRSDSPFDDLIRIRSINRDQEGRCARGRRQKRTSSEAELFTGVLESCLRSSEPKSSVEARRASMARVTGQTLQTAS